MEKIIDKFLFREAGAIAQINLILQEENSEIRVKDYCGEVGNTLVFTTFQSGGVLVLTEPTLNAKPEIVKVITLARQDIEQYLNKNHQPTAEKQYHQCI